MERKLQERMIGAGVLILLLVIVGPMVLDGESDERAMDRVPPGERGEELRSHTFRLDGPADAKAPQAAPDLPASDPQPRPAVADATVPARQPVVEAPSAAPASAAVPDRPPGPPVAKAAEKPPRPAPGPQPGVRPAAGPTPAGAGFVVQLGTFGQKGNAERLTESLRKDGFEAFVSPTTRGDKSLYRVRVGPPATRAEAERLAARLAGAGHKGQLVAQ